MELCEASWRPVSLRLLLAGEHELWRFSDWREWQPGLWLAAAAVQTSSCEGSPANTYQLGSLAVHPSLGSSSMPAGAAAAAAGFAPPPTPLLPADAEFVRGAPEAVPAWHTVSGHRCGPALRLLALRRCCPAALRLHQPLQGCPHPTHARTLPPSPRSSRLPRSLVRPRLNGREVGWFILDTGASGFVLDPQAANSLGLESFGELQVGGARGVGGMAWRCGEGG